MQTQCIESPFVLGKPIPAGQRLASPEWIINKLLLPEGGQMACVSIVHRLYNHLDVDVLQAAIGEGRT